jgi:hypothetical protein
MSVPLRIHPANSKIFEFRGKPRMLLCATEHYGAVMNRPFRFERYLADHAEKEMTLSRLFVLFRELQGPTNPYSTCKPESPDYIAPFRRTGPGVALDGQPKYDLDQWNPEFFERLHRFLGLASKHGIVVEVTLLSNTYADSIWALHPLNDQNNLNGLEKIAWPEYLTTRYPKLLERQLAHVRKIVEETNRYDNILYEICNEPGGNANFAMTNCPTLDEVDRWQMRIADCIRETERKLPNRHLIAGQEAFDFRPFTQGSTKTFGSFGVDIVNMHPLPNTTYRGKSYDMGQFMAKQLKLRAVRDFCLATQTEAKPLNFDEDNSSSQYKDYDGWTIHRKRAWMTLLSLAHYDYIDFSIINYCETGTPQSRKHIRSWMKHLSRFIHSVDLPAARPLTGFLTSQPAHTLEAVLAVEGKDYCIYLADDRELTETGAGEPIKGTLSFKLPPGTWRMAFYSPQTGRYSPPTRIRGGPAVTVQMPSFRHDLVIQIRRTGR